MIFLDTSAIFAVTDTSDPQHDAARSAFSRAVDDGEELLIHNYILVESLALIQRRLGLEPARRLIEDRDGLLVHWMTGQDHAAAENLLIERNQRRLSFVDCASFVVMRMYGVNEAIAFDSDFETEGFALYRS